MPATLKFRKGQHVRYRLDRVGKGYKVAAIVRRVHRDGTVTVEALFVVNPQDERQGGYLGYRYRYDADLLSGRVTAMNNNPSPLETASVREAIARADADRQTYLAIHDLIRAHGGDLSCLDSVGVGEKRGFDWNPGRGDWSL